MAVERVVMYDIGEAIGDSQQALAAYSTSLALPASLPVPFSKVMYSADCDLTPPIS